MTRRERLESKLNKRHEWAKKAESRSDAAFQHSVSLTAGIPMGQPILVGHYSEKRHRRTLDRSWNALGRSVAESKLAEHHEQKAAGLSYQLEHTIFSDDTDAVTALEARINEREADRVRMKSANAAWRKKNSAKLQELTGHDLAWWTVELEKAYSWCKQPYPAFELSNLGAKITADKKRLEHVKRQAARTEKASASETGIIIEGTGEYIRVTFAEKPERSILNYLREAGFRWGGGSWTGQRVKLPKSVNVA